MKAPPRKSVIERVSDEFTLPDLSRVLHVSTEEDAIILFPLVDPPKKPLFAKLSKISEGLQNGTLKISQLVPPSYIVEGETTITDAARIIRDKNWEMIEPLIATGFQIFGPDRGQLIKDRAAELGKSEKAIYRVLYRYWYYGMSKDALIPAISKCGAKGSTRTSKSGKKLGRPSKVLKMTKDPQLIGVNVAQQDRQNFNKAIDLFYVAEGKNLKKTYQKMWERFYNSGYTEANGVRVPILKPAHLIPTPRQFQYWYRKERDEMTLIKARSLPSDWEMNYRSITGTAEQNVAGPCARFEIDATIADVFLVSEVIGPQPQIAPKKHGAATLWQGGMRSRGRPK